MTRRSGLRMWRKRRTFDAVKSGWDRYVALHQRAPTTARQRSACRSFQQIFLEEVPLYTALSKWWPPLSRLTHGYASESGSDIVDSYQSANLSVTIALVIGLILVLVLSRGTDPPDPRSADHAGPSGSSASRTAISVRASCRSGSAATASTATSWVSWGRPSTGCGGTGRAGGEISPAR